MEKHVFLEHEEAIHEKKLKSQAQRELSAETINGFLKNKLEEIKKDPSKNITEGQNSIDSNRA
jgi:CRISPR/Cas system-associated endonuclease Cas3-HD